jgi:hypothetical protein
VNSKKLKNLEGSDRLKTTEAEKQTRQGSDPLAFGHLLLAAIAGFMPVEACAGTHSTERSFSSAFMAPSFQRSALPTSAPFST